MSKRHYSDNNGENVLHMYTPFSLDLGEGYDYQARGWRPTAIYYFLHVLAATLLDPVLRIALGFRIVGRKNARALRGHGVVTVSNHVHPLDCVMLSLGIGLRRIYYVSLASNFCIPVVRHLVRGLGGVPLSGEPGQTTRLIKEMTAALKDGAAVQMYPEGVLTPYSGEPHAFKRGAFLLAAQAGTPVLPMAFTIREPAGLYRLFRRKPLLTLHVAPAVYPDASLPERQRIQRLQESCREAMFDAIRGSGA